MKITDVIITFQAWCRGYVARKYAETNPPLSFFGRESYLNAPLSRVEGKSDAVVLNFNIPELLPRGNSS